MIGRKYSVQGMLNIIVPRGEWMMGRVSSGIKHYCPGGSG